MQACGVDSGHDQYACSLLNAMTVRPVRCFYRPGRQHTHIKAEHYVSFWRMETFMFVDTETNSACYLFSQ